MLRYTLLALIAACGGGPGCGSRSASAPPPEREPSSPIQAVHEWGLVSVGQSGVELAAGPGRQQPRHELITIDKPVLYVHASAPSALQVEVTPGAGMSLAEHFPPSLAPASSPLTWHVNVAPGECTTPRDYTGACNSTDGYCETNELALYETSDAACLTQDEFTLPLLFYRLRADSPPALPLSVSRGDDNEVIVVNTGLEAGASIWRVSWDGGQAHAVRALAPALGDQLIIQRAAHGGVAEVRAAIREDLAGLGLTLHEAEAFMRAWDSALFGARGSVDGNNAAVDGIPADLPVRASNSLTTDETAADETTLDRRMIPGAPRIADTILYWLPAENIESLAALSFSPTPQEVSRAILVRVDAG